jgi:hypothetical protein
MDEIDPGRRGCRVPSSRLSVAGLRTAVEGQREGQWAGGRRSDVEKPGSTRQLDPVG